jgi:hypothetical protein
MTVFVVYITYSCVFGEQEETKIFTTKELADSYLAKEKLDFGYGDQGCVVEEAVLDSLPTEE